MLLIALFAAACSSSLKNIFSKQTPHEQYAEVLDYNDLIKRLKAGNGWLFLKRHWQMHKLLHFLTANMDILHQARQEPLA